VVLTLLATIGRNPDALDTLSTTTVVLLLLAFIMVNTAVLVLRNDEVEHEHFRTPTVFPVLGILVSAGLLVYSAIDDWTVFGLAGLMLGIGVVLYGVNILAKRSLDRETPGATG
jgi:basic amino acid/polyamine antiporter, APA family